jgi:hypothetical protein
VIHLIQHRHDPHISFVLMLCKYVLTLVVITWGVPRAVRCRDYVSITVYAAAALIVLMGVGLSI